jgi:uncharacterized damage-inducible protein DinB
VPEEFEGDLAAAVFWGADLSGARFRDVNLTDVTISHAWLVDVQIDAFVDRLVVNGVDVTAFVNEHDPWYPLRSVLRVADPEGMRTGWAALREAWAATVARAQRLPAEDMHESVDGEWSFVQTLRHLVYASDLWVFSVVQGVPDAYDPLDLPFDGYARFPNPIRYQRDVRPPLADVLTLRADRVARVRAFLDELTQQQIDSTVAFRSESWPFDEDFPVGPCLATVVNEEWHHRTYAERDLAKLMGRA